MRLGERIRELVDAKNLTHSWVAIEAGMTPTSFSRILNGETEDPSFFTVLRIAIVIKEPISAIAGDAPLIWSNQDLERLAADSTWAAARAERTPSSMILDIPPRTKRSGSKRVFPVAADRRGSLEPESFELPSAKIPAEFRKRGADAVFSVIGESMIGAGYHEGDMIYVVSTRDVRRAENKIVVCTVDGVPLLKGLIVRDGTIVLESAHPRERSMKIPNDSAFAVSWSVAGPHDEGSAGAQPRPSIPDPLSVADPPSVIKVAHVMTHYVSPLMLSFYTSTT